MDLSPTAIWLIWIVIVLAVVISLAIVIRLSFIAAATIRGFREGVAEAEGKLRGFEVKPVAGQATELKERDNDHG
jgi:hypothetical protein